uniref:Uncharacterized protein n=1 Tax=Arundo donax TaxID=35708 RepID=A0A0A9C1S4_ARUDO
MPLDTGVCTLHLPWHDLINTLGILDYHSVVLLLRDD